MPRPDNEELVNVPSMVPDRDDMVSYQRQKHGKSHAKEHDGEAADRNDVRGSGTKNNNAMIYIVGFIALAAVGAAGYLFTQLQGAQERVSALEQKLSSTDASVNQSSGTLQVKINEVNASVAQLRDEIQKKYKTQIDQQAGQIAALDKAGKSAQSAIAANDRALATQSKALVEQNKAIDTLRTDVGKLPALIDPVKQRADQQQAALDALSGKVKAVNDAQTKLDGRLSNTEEWIDSINVFRKQMNREIVNIKQQIVGGKPATPPAELQ